MFYLFLLNKSEPDTGNAKILGLGTSGIGKLKVNIKGKENTERKLVVILLEKEKVKQLFIRRTTAKKHSKLIKLFS